MPHGGFAPFPRRHSSGSTVYGESAAHYARQVADNVAVKRTRKLCVLTFTTDGATASITAYFGFNGNGLFHKPDTITVNGTGDTSLEWTDIASFVDDYEVVHSLKPRAAACTSIGSAYSRPVWELLDTGVRIRTFNASGVAVNADVTVTLWGSENAKISDYDGAPDKLDSETEGEIPYAWSWYRDYTAMLGSAFTVERDTLATVPS